MSFVLLQQVVAPEELKILKEEFPQYEFLVQVPGSVLSKEEWHGVEVLYGDHLTAEELASAQMLRWIHVPSIHLHHLCMRQIEETSNLLITNTKTDEVHQQAEYVMATVLAFAKNLFDWERERENPQTFWNSPYRSLTWTLRERTFLQIGLGNVGAAIAEKAHNFGMRTWGIAPHASFHPNFDKTFDYVALPSLLPAVDVLCLAIPRGQRPPVVLKRAHLERMKRDSILVVVGSEDAIEEKALIEATLTNKFRAVVIDLSTHKGVKSPLWKTPGIFITPELAPCPEEADHLSFRQFQYNFRRYIHSDYMSMKNLLKTQLYPLQVST
ncbi:MAG: D-2-hydroxyacid dehydrogenase [Verrucomicrobia bacterium]|nr:D-2-hydroxyacid dehydrogenase [Verrucomicrobiota bacterium]